MSHHKIKGESEYLLRTRCRDARRYNISGIYTPQLRLLYWNIPHESFVEAVVSAIPSYLNLTNINFIAGKYEISGWGFQYIIFSGKTKLHDVLAQATSVFYFMLSNLSCIIAMSFLIRILLDYFTLSIKFIFKIQIFKLYCLEWKGVRELGIKSDECRTHNSRDWKIKLILIHDVVPQGRYSNPRYSD
jgi:hypothetical protein